MALWRLALLVLASAALAHAANEAEGESLKCNTPGCALEPTLISDPDPAVRVPRNPNVQKAPFVWLEDPAPHAYVYRGTNTQHSNCPTPSIAPSDRPSDCAASASAGSSTNSWLEVDANSLVVDAEYSAEFAGMQKAKTDAHVEAGKCDSCSYDRDQDRVNKEIAEKVSEKMKEEKEFMRAIKSSAIKFTSPSASASPTLKAILQKKADRDEDVIPATVAADVDDDVLATDHEGNPIPSLPHLSPDPAEREIVPPSPTNRSARALALHVGVGLGPLPAVIPATPMITVVSSFPARQSSPYVWREDPARHPHVYRKTAVQSHCQPGDESCMQGQAHNAIPISLSLLELSSEIRPSSTSRGSSSSEQQHDEMNSNVADTLVESDAVADDAPTIELEEGSLLEATDAAAAEFVNGPICCYAKHVGNKWVPTFTPSSGGCKDAQQEASRLTLKGAGGVTSVKFMGLFQHFYASQDNNRACEVIVNNMNRKLLSMESHDNADVGGCVGDCGSTPRGLFCCYVVKDQTAAAYRYLGNIATQHSGCMSALAHYRMRKAQHPGNSAIGTPHYTAEYHVCRNPIDTLQDCARFAMHFGRIDPPMPVDGKAL